MKYCLKEGIDATFDNIQVVYNTAAELSETVDEKLPISTKSKDDIEAFLREHTHILNVYKSICLAHIQEQSAP